MRYLIFALMLAMSATRCAQNAFADVSVDRDRGTTTFKVNNKTVEPDVAVKAASQGAEVLRCKPKSAGSNKIYFSSNGQVSEVLECVPVELKVNPKTGSPKWVVVK